MAALLWAGEGAALSHTSAARILGLDINRPFGKKVEISTPRNLRCPNDSVIVHAISGDLPTRRVGRFVVTDPIQTLLDLGGVLGCDDLEIALDSALRLRLVSIPRLKSALENSPRRKGLATLRRLVAERDGNGISESGLETRFFRLLIKYDVPLPTRQFSSNFGGEKSRLDCAYMEERVAIEVDSSQWHTTIQAFHSDRARDRRLAEEGWITLRFTDRDIRERPAEVAAQIKRVLKARRELLATREMADSAPFGSQMGIWEAWAAAIRSTISPIARVRS